MDNKTIYKKTFGFSLRRLLWDFFSLALFLVLGTLGFMLGEKLLEEGVIGLIIGMIIALIVVVILMRYVSYRLKAGQIAMMTRGITEGSLPDDVIAAGKQVVKEHFLTVAAYFAATNAIKGIFNQLSKVISKVGSAIGGDTGGTIGDVISSAVQTLVSYLCDCCLGWVFYRKNVKAGKATCEGAVLFFKHGKTLLKNVGRIFGIGLASLLLIGGVFSVIFYAILSASEQALSGLYEEIASAAAESEGTIAELLQNPATLPIVVAVILGILVWSFIHSTFIRPFVLTGVLRNYLESGMNDIPSEESFAELDSKSKKFAELHSSL